MSKHKVIQNQFISPGIYHLVIEKNGIEFAPGACASILNRTYSIASAPASDVLEFYIRRIPGGVASDTLHRILPGEIIEIDEVFQYFFPGMNCTSGKYVYIATGTGIAPMISALRHYQHTPAAIIVGARESHDIILPADAVKVSSSIIQCVSREPGSEYKRVTDALKAHQDLIDPEFRYFVCGLDQMIDDISNQLIHSGVDFSNISTEQFFYTT